MILTPLIPLPFSEEGHQDGRDRWAPGTWLCGGPGPGRKGPGQGLMLYAHPDLICWLVGCRESGYQGLPMGVHARWVQDQELDAPPEASPA